jgi:metal-responsive CopG/Arc/MetJ family transcriptional regulator
VTAIRLPADLKARVDEWAASQPDMPRRSEALRRLIEKALSADQ